MLAVLTRLFRRRPAPATRPPPPARVPLREERRPPQSFEAFAALLQLEPPPAPALSESDAIEDERMVDAVVTHYLANKPGPESFPGLSLQILNMVAAPDIDARKLARLVSRDPALSASLLRVANSAFYRGASPIQTVRDALARMGMTEVARVASVVAARSLFNPKVRADYAV
ncbi:MAG TPA: HDOD domain-containing protein, partial [Myxococcales bacterium]|nr:HDOD domain-containing protein [Myxococcales bacterium]